MIGAREGAACQAAVQALFAVKARDMESLRRRVNDIAFAGEGRIEMIYRTGPNWTIRGGFTFFYLDGIALAAENFGTAAPPNLTAIGVAPRLPARNDNGEAFYHGGHIGLEYVW